MKAPAQLVQEFVLAKLDGATLAERATLYRSLADLAGTASERNELRSLAKDTDALHARHLKLVLNFTLAATDAP